MVDDPTSMDMNRSVGATFSSSGTFPQQYIEPSPPRAQLWELPAATAVKVPSGDLTWSGTSSDPKEASDSHFVMPSASILQVTDGLTVDATPPPQHSMEPSSLIAQLCAPPALTDVNDPEGALVCPRSL